MDESIVAEKVVARLTHTRPLVTQFGAIMFGSDNRYSIEKARRELGYEPKVDLHIGIKLAAEWFNAGGMNEPAVTQASTPHSPGHASNSSFARGSYATRSTFAAV